MVHGALQLGIPHECLKLDMFKAFDRIEGRFIESDLGIGEYFIGFFLVIRANETSTLIINGRATNKNDVT